MGVLVLNNLTLLVCLQCVQYINRHKPSRMNGTMKKSLICLLVIAISDVVTSCGSGIDLPSVPSIPGLKRRSVRGIPDIPGIPGIPGIDVGIDIPGVDIIDNLPDIPGLDNIPNIPSIPSFPGMKRRSVRGIPDIPGIPSIPDIPGLDIIDNLPDIPGLDIIDNLPDIPGLDNIPNIPSFPGMKRRSLRDPVKDCAAKLKANPDLIVRVVKGNQEAGCKIIRYLDATIGSQGACLDILKSFMGTPTYKTVPKMLAGLQSWFGEEQACKTFHELIELQKNN